MNEQEIEIVKGNTLIAVFMGGIFLRKQDCFDESIVREYIKFGKGVLRDEIWNGTQNASTEDQTLSLSYDRYWFWLMPVIEKIESLGYRFKRCRRRVDIEPDDQPLSRIWVSEKHETPMKSAWVACVKFIYHYNNPTHE